MPRTPRHVPNRTKRDFYTRGSIVYPWSSPIPVIFVEGDSSEMGTQFTKATKGLTRQNISFNLPIVERILKKSGINKRDYVKEMEDAISRYTTSDYLDEMQSIADVAGFEYESVLLVNANVDIMSTLPGAKPEDDFSCSTFAAWGNSVSSKSTTIAGHNDDGNRVMDQYSVLKIAKPKHGFSFVCAQVPGYLAYDCLVNANQVFVCGTAIDNKMKRSEGIRDGVPNWVMYRWLGQFSTSASDATSRLLTAKNMTIKNWCFVSREGGKVVEATPKHHCTMSYPSKAKDWYGVSTCIVCPELMQYVIQSEKPTSGVYRMKSVIREVRERHGKVTPESAIEILSSHYDSLRKRNLPSEHTPCRHMEFEGKLAGTCRCIVASFYRDDNDRPSSTRMDVSLGNPCNGYWRRLYFDEKFNLKSGYHKSDKFERRLNQTLVSI